MELEHTVTQGMWEKVGTLLKDGKEGGALKKGCLQTMVLDKTSESPLDCKGIKPVNLKGNQH